MDKDLLRITDVAYATPLPTLGTKETATLIIKLQNSNHAITITIHGQVLTLEKIDDLDVRPLLIKYETEDPDWHNNILNNCRVLWDMFERLADHLAKIKRSKEVTAEFDRGVPHEKV